MQLAKFENGQLITTCADEEDRERVNAMVADRFKYFVEAESPDISSVQLSKFASLELRYRDEPHQIVAYYEIIDQQSREIAEKLSAFKPNLPRQITGSSNPTALTGEQPSYDIEPIHRERQAIRNRIKELEGMI